MLQFASQIIGAVGDAASAVSQMSPEDMKKFAVELGSKGYTGLMDLEGSALAEKLGEITGVVAVEAALMLTGSAAASAAFKAFKGTTTGRAVISTAEATGAAVKTRVAAFVSDEAAALAKTRLLKVFPVGGQPLAILPGAISPQIIADFSIVAANKLGKAAAYGGMRFERFANEMTGKFGETVKPYLEKITAQWFGIKMDLHKILDSPVSPFERPFTTEVVIQPKW